MRKNYRKSLNVYRYGKIDDAALPYEQFFPDDGKSDEQFRPVVDAIIADNNNNIDSSDLLSNTIFDENLAKPGRRVSKFFKTIET